MKKLIFSAALLLANLCATAQHPLENLIPQPKDVKVLSSQSTTASPIVNYVIDTKMASEAYKIIIKDNTITISGANAQAHRWASQTLKQLRAADGTYPQVEIYDYPSFAIRGFMHDTGRNFIEVDMLIEHLRLMSQYKINVFQWHLTDNPAWRIECRAYPQLNDAKFQRKGRDEGRFYTYDQIRQVIDTARSLGIMVIPEIDMPGHSKFFIDTFGFTMDSPEGMKVLEECLNEFFTEIPTKLCPIFHAGSDEVSISDPRGFMQWVESLVSSHNRTMVGWDPGLPVSDKVIRQIWNEAAGANSGAAKKPGAYLDSFIGYLNYYDPIVYTNRAYLHTPCARHKGDSTALGGILCLWNDVNVDNKDNIALHNGMVNGMMVFSERFWNGGKFEEVTNPNVLPAPTTKAAQSLQSFERKMSYHRDNLLSKIDVRWVANSHIPWTIDIDGKQIKAWGGAIDMNALCAENQIKHDQLMPAKATTKIYANCDTTITAWIGFEAAARSNRISGGIGNEGEWENEGVVMVNGVAVAPPVAWNEPGKYKFPFNTWHRPEEEFVYTNEQFYWMREPAVIKLNKGWNTVELSCPKTFKGQRWSFAFIPVTVKGDRVSEVPSISFK